MNKLVFAVLIILCTFISTKLNAQESTQNFEYRRSSLSMILIESQDFPNKKAVMDSWDNFPFPDKYNEHEVEMKSTNIDIVKLSNEKEKAEKKEYQLKIEKEIKDKKLANQLVATWFNRDENGKFDMSLIQERGFYNATEMEAGIAQGQARGLASLGDAGEELIRNTFVTFTKLNFIENEPVAKKVRDAAKKKIKSSAIQSELIREASLKSADVAYEATKDGYSLWSKTWLYRLNWDDSIAAVFYNNLWSDPAAFDTTNLFSLEFVGVQYNQSLVLFKTEERTQEMIIDLALVRNIDNAFSQLQKDHDVFKPKIPVLTGDPITAQIGKKEGLTGGEKFDVLEMTYNKKTGKTEYKVVGKAKVDKKKIWDNRYNAGEDVESELDEDGNPITATTFKGSKKIQPGMLLKQQK